MVSRWVFAGLLGLLAVQRLLELRLSRRNEAALRAVGGQEHGAGHFGVMKALHAGWFAAALIEVFSFKRRFRPWLAALALAAAGAGQILRYSAIRTLGERWSVRVITLPGRPPVRQGIYRYLRHPNYLGVVLELLAVPLIHSAYLTAALFSLANLALLRRRVQVEEDALEISQNITSKRL